MTSRERLLTVLGGGIPDRVPVSFFVQEEFLSFYFPGRSRIRRLEEAVQCAGELGFDVMVRGKEFEVPHFMKKSFPGWELSIYEKAEGGNRYFTYEIKTPSRTLKQVEVGPDIEAAMSGIHRSTCEYLIKDRDDLEAFRKYVPHIDPETIREMGDYAQHSRKVIGDLGICVPWGWAGIYNQAATYRSVEALMMDPYMDEAFYEDYMGTLTELMIEYNSALAGVGFDAIGIQGNIANSGMVGTAFFEEHILPYEKRLVDAISERGTHTVYHNCGKARVLQGCYVKMGLTAWETIAEDPQGDNTLRQAKENVGESLVLIGNIDQVNFLKTASPNQIRARVEEMMSIGKPGGKYIFAASDFLEAGTPVENIIAAIAAAKEFGLY